MKWFKHRSDSWDSEGLAQIVGGGGMEGLARYGLYWRVLEIVAAQVDGTESSCTVKYPVSRWALLLSLRGSLVFSALSKLAVTGERQGSDKGVTKERPSTDLAVTVERDGSDIRVTISNLFGIKDNYTRNLQVSAKSIARNLSATCKQRIEVEEKRKDPPIPPGGESPSAPVTAKKRSTKAAVFELPDWVDREAWDAYVDMRKQIKKPLTEAAKKLEVGVLMRLRDSGDDPKAVLEQSTRKCWQSLYKLPADDPSKIEPPKPKKKFYHLDGTPVVGNGMGDLNAELFD